MSKYAALQDHLARLDRAEIAMSFAEIEAVLGFPLPTSARRQRSWWSNNPINHTQANSWLEAGFVTEDVDMEAERLVFFRRNARGQRLSGFGEEKQARLKGDTSVGAGKPHRHKKGDPHPLFGIWVGKVTLLPDYDYTQPLEPDWGRLDDAD